MNQARQKRIANIAEIARNTLPSYEIRGVFRVVETTPAGDKCKYLERGVGEIPLEHLFGGVLLACPRGDRTNGAVRLEISTRDRRIYVDKNTSSHDAQTLGLALRKRGYDFSIRI